MGSRLPGQRDYARARLLTECISYHNSGEAPMLELCCLVEHV